MYEQNNSFLIDVKRAASTNARQRTAQESDDENRATTLDKIYG